MNTSIKVLTVLSLCLSAHNCFAQDGSKANPLPTASIFLLDDQSGPELERLHGIKSIKISDMEVLLDGVAQGRRPVRLFNQVVDEDASDNEIITLEFRPFNGGEFPVANLDNLPLGELDAAQEEFDKKAALWHGKMKAYITQLKGQAEGFIRKIAVNQAAVTERFGKLLKARNGREFNRSDVAGSVLSANQALGTEGCRILIINSDCVDLPANRKPRTTPFSTDELSPGVSIIFVNQSKIPDSTPLFKGLRNPVFHADTMKEAMDLALNILGETPPDAQQNPL